MYWQEVPYRAATVLRSLAQSKGLFTADRVPQRASDARWGVPWSAVPSDTKTCEPIEAAARRLIDGELLVFGHPVPMPRGIPDWNADPVTGTRIEPVFGLFIDFRHLGNGVDIKFLWEVNRHLWWVPIAQQYALTNDRRYLDRVGDLLKDWLTACPYARGANWSSPVEHGIRLINWSLVWHFIGGSSSPLFDGAEGAALLDRWLDSIYQHMRFASDNYSFYSSADNHLIGEAAGVFVAAHIWDQWPESRQMRREAKAILERETLLQFGQDGVNLEQATCYHKFSLQFLIASALCGRVNGDDFSPEFWGRIQSAMVFLAAVMDVRGRVPAIGDSDDGEVWTLAPGISSYRAILAMGAALFQRGDLQAKAQSADPASDLGVAWLNGLVSPDPDDAGMGRLPTRFEAGGYVVLGRSLHRPDEFRLIFDCGPLGYNRISGHGHADALSIQLSDAGTQLLVDPGTYCYNAAPEFRHYFRGTHAHNTLVVDGVDQSEYGGSFLWLRDVHCNVVAEAGASATSIRASHDGYRRLADPVVHHRRVTLVPGEREVVIEDWIESGSAHDVELLWHVARDAKVSAVDAGSWLLRAEERAWALTVGGGDLTSSIIEGRESPPQGWTSGRFYERSKAPVISARCRLAPRQVLRTVIRPVL